MMNRLIERALVKGSCAVLAATALVMGGCSEDREIGKESGSSASQGSGGGVGGQGGSGDGGGGQGGSGGGGPCAAGTLCLDVSGIGEGALFAGRLAVVWSQLNDDGPDPAPNVGFDVEFTGLEKRVEIPLSSMGLPTAENLYCVRACDDEAICPCVGYLHIGAAMVGVFTDVDDDGKADITDYDFDNAARGVGQVMIVYSEKAISTAPAPLTEGIDAGVRPSVVVEAPSKHFARTQDGDVFELKVCPATDTACKPPIPDLE